MTTTKFVAYSGDRAFALRKSLEGQGIMGVKKNIFQEDIRVVVKRVVAGLNKDGVDIDKRLADKIEEKMLEVLTYQPRVGMLGKTGSGKSSLCNAIFGSDTAKIDDVKGCTRSPQEILVKFGHEKGIVLVDVPGVGETIERDKEYRELYKKLMPELDLVVWVVKADDRALTIDQLVVMEDVKPLLKGRPFVVAINQVDKINPIREWNARRNQPGATQSQNIQEKRELVAKFFAISTEHVIPVSAEEKYNLVALVEAMIFSLPDNQKPALFREIKEEYKSEKAEIEVKRGFAKVLEDALDKTIKIYEKVKPYIPAIIAGIKFLWNATRKK